MSDLSLIVIVLIYLGILFYIAFWGNKNHQSKWVNNPYIYTLSLAVYCTAWTYYGSVGTAAESGMNFLPIYIGPVIALPLWIILMRKIIRIAKQHKIASVADFIVLRYGGNRFLGALITVICLVATIPYLALQLKAISETYYIISNGSNAGDTHILTDSAFYIALVLAVFVTFFSTQKTDASTKNKGIMATVAFESALKLLFFLILGVYVTFYLFEGTSDIYESIKTTDNFSKLIGVGGFENGIEWFLLIVLSFFAIFLLPRQFQVSVVENNREKHLKKAIWLFPLYLLLFNLFVIFIAWGGKLTFGDSVNSDYYSLLLPLANGDEVMALLVFLGGFSAVISMVVVSTIALANMVSNNLVIPYGFLDKFAKNNPSKNVLYIKSIRRIAIFSIILVSYFFYSNFSVQISLYSIGLISFVIIALLAPSFFIGLFWKRGSSKGTIVGIIVGFSIICYTLIIPFVLKSGNVNSAFVENGLFGIELLRPYQLFGVDFLSPATHAFFWSFLFNTMSFLWVSVSGIGNYRERNYAEMFINDKEFANLPDSAYVWKGEAYVKDIKRVLVRFLGEARTERALTIFFKKYSLSPETTLADARLVNFSEKLLNGIIGGSSAKILIASVIKEEEISLPEVLKILEESKKTLAHNKLLNEQSKELSKLASQLTDANQQLVVKDQQKDEFLDAVAHEIKTPMTGIKGAAELLVEEGEEMPVEIREQFLKNILQDTNRLTRMVQNILDFEKLAEQREQLKLKRLNFKFTLQQAVKSISQLANKKNTRVEINTHRDAYAFYDEDRMLQVLTNIFSNAIKFSDELDGEILVLYKISKKYLVISISDNGKGVPEEDLPYVFDKFYQSKNQNIIKREGSGLGLAISKRIVERHNGTIRVKNEVNYGANFIIKIPTDKETNEKKDSNSR
jgi:Na+/proline symporter/signal transduction histidine kinase